LDRALEIQKERGEKIGKILVDLGFVAMGMCWRRFSDQWQIPLVAIDGPPPAAPETEASFGTVFSAGSSK